MDIYNGWFDLKRGVSDVEFADSLNRFLGKMKADGKIAGYRLMRRKLGLGIPGQGDFHIAIEVEGMAQLDDAFNTVSMRSDPIESLHHAVNSKVTNLTFSLYRDFPDPQRKRGEEKF